MKGWFLPEDAVNSLVAKSLNDLIRRAKWSHMADVQLRENGKDVWFEADWIKYMEFVEISSPQPSPLAQKPDEH